MSVESPIISDDLREYVDSVGYAESNILKENRKETKKLGAISIMQIGAAQGALLSILCKISKFKNCLEVGVFTGYSSLCIGSSISDDSKLTCIDNNKEYLNVAIISFTNISSFGTILGLDNSLDSSKAPCHLFVVPPILTSSR